MQQEKLMEKNEIKEAESLEEESEERQKVTHKK